MVPSIGMGLVGVGVHRMIHTCTRRLYPANYSQQFLNSATTMHSLNLRAQRCMGFCKRNKGSLLFGAFATWVTISYVRIQIVPYTRKIQLVSNEKEEERRAEFRWKMLMEDCKGNDCLLPLSDPRSIRVQSIAANMIKALKVGLRLEKECKVNGHSCEIDGNYRDYMKPNQMWDHKLLWKPSTKHLDNGKDWEVYVFNCIEKEVALLQSGHVCHFNKRIVISRGLLDGLKSDAELAALIGHQIGHIVGRHIARIYVRFRWNLFRFNHIFSKEKFSPLLEWAWASLHKWNEREANHIGLMLMAFAGYDPQAAIEAFKKMGQIYDDNILKGSKEMGNALVVYREVKSLMNLNANIQSARWFSN